LVIWPVKIVPEMTYYVLSGTLSLYTTTTVDETNNQQFFKRTLILCRQYNDSSVSRPINHLFICSK